jgi:hypothetical protein
MYARGEAVGAIARRLSRSDDAVTARRRLLHIQSRRQPRPWSGLEDALLRAAVQSGASTTALSASLARSVHDVRARRRSLGLPVSTRRRYSSADDALLRDRWAASDVGALAQRLGRSPDALRVHAEALGLHRPRRRRRWSAAEDATVRDGYTGGQTCRRIAAMLPGRTPGAVAARARKLGLSTYARAWTAQEDARLRTLAARCSPTDIARSLGRTPEAVRLRGRLLALDQLPRDPAPRAGATWSREEDALLRRHPNLNPAALAAHLGRSDRAVAARLRRLGLRGGRERSPHHPAPASRGLTPGEQRLVNRELVQPGHSTLLAVARRLERPPAELRKLVEQHANATDQPRKRMAAR